MQFIALRCTRMAKWLRPTWCQSLGNCNAMGNGNLTYYFLLPSIAEQPQHDPHVLNTRKGWTAAAATKRGDNLSTQLGQEEQDDVLCHPPLRCSGCQRQRQRHLLLGNIQTPTKEDVELKTIVDSMIIIIIIARKLETCTPGDDLGFVTASVA